MGHYYHISTNIKVSPGKPDKEGQTPVELELAWNESGLLPRGVNLQIAIGRPQSEEPDPKTLATSNPLVIPAHLDTGAYMTIIDKGVVDELGLTPVGKKPANGIGGVMEGETYFLDIAFPGQQLKAIRNFQVLALSSASVKGSALLGRDILARWNITWHGPTSTVLISD